MDGGMDEEERNDIVEQDGSCPAHCYGSEHEIFVELERERSSSQR